MAETSKTIKSGMFFRTFQVDRKAVNEEARTVELSFSSETKEVERFFGIEILDHSPKSVRLKRLNSGGPLFVDHDGDQVGVVDKAFLEDKRGQAIVRFSKSVRASEVFQDVVDGIRKSISIGYRVYRMILEEEREKEPNIYRAVDWEPLEISLVAMPADLSVGVGRASQKEQYDITILEREGAPMTEPNLDVKTVKQEAMQAERSRVSEIMAIGERHGCQELARKSVENGESLDDFRRSVLESRYKANPIQMPDPEIGLTAKESKQFSFVRAINAVADRKWDNAPFEKECSDAVAKKFQKQPQGFFVPREVQTRDLTKGTFSAGGALVDTDLLTGSFIELIRNRMMVRQLGATILSGLIGDIAIPKQTGGATAYWVGESVDPTESQQAFKQLGMTPKSVGAYTDISRKLLNQASLDVELFVRSDLATVLALALDLAAINGSGAAGEPLGILQTTGIGDVPGGTNGAAPTWPLIVNLWKEVSKDNAAFGTLAYLTNSDAIGKLLTVDKASGAAQFIVTGFPDANGITAIAGARAGISNQVPNDLTKGSGTNLSAIIFGNWADLIIAEWGALDVLVDPFTGGLAGTLRIRVLQDVDVAIRHAESFAAMQDVITS